MSKNNLDANSLLRACRRLFLLTLMMLVPVAHAAAQESPALRWELVNPFRFIDQAAYDDLRRIYAGLSLKTAAGLETELQTRSLREAAERECVREPPGSQRQKCLESGKIHDPGWFARLAENDHGRTCWDSKHLRFKNDGTCANYIHPKTHRVRVWVVDPQRLGGSAPRWRAGGTTPVKFEECSGEYPKGTCVEFDARYDPKEQGGTEITAVSPGDGLTLGRADVFVRDLLVVGLGDSYASGEGNPDIPARFTRERFDIDIWYGLKRAPRKDEDSKVGWLDSRCHRSMYSYQFKTALHLALENPQQAVTYVSFSCSGAATDNIFRKEQSAQEGQGKVEKQLKSLELAMAGGSREIDYLLVSTGGNDVQFAKYVTYVATRGLLKNLAASGIGRESVENRGRCEIAKLLLGQSTGKYPELDAALRNTDGVKIKGCEAGKLCPRILLTTYPDILHSETGQPCQAERGEFDSTFGKDTKRGERLRQVAEHIVMPLRKTQTEPFISDKFGWTVVTEHVAKYREHGFCAQNSKSTSRTAEKFVMPERRNGEWFSFDPREYRAYETRQRWVRIPVDSKLTTDQVILPFLGRLGFDLMFKDDTSNIMHPTAEGHAATADANVKAIEGVEKKLRGNGVPPGR